MILSAEIWHSIASSALIVSLAVGVVSSAIIVYTGNIKENILKQELSQNSIELGKNKTELEKAKLETASINNKTKTLELEIEKESLKRIESEIALENLRIKLQNRSLSTEQRKILITYFSNVSGKKQISIESLHEKESSEYAKQIGSALAESGVEIKLSFTVILVPPMYGLIVPSSSDYSELRNAFDKAKIEYKIDNYKHVIIGHKPLIDP